MNPRRNALADLLSLAKRFNIKSAQSIINKAIEITSTYRNYALEVNVPEEWIRKIEAEIAERMV